MRKAKEKGLLIRSAANMSTSNTTESTNSGVGGGGGGGGSGMGSGGGAMTTVVFDSSSSSKDNRTSTYTSTTLPLSSSSSHHHHHSKANPIYKQRAYLSKGVPVILYEEMSDKPLEDYDENNANSTGGTSSRNVGSYYR